MSQSHKMKSGSTDEVFQEQLLSVFSWSFACTRTVEERKQMKAHNRFLLNCCWVPTSIIIFCKLVSEYLFCLFDTKDTFRFSFFMWATGSPRRSLGCSFLFVKIRVSLHCCTPGGFFFFFSCWINDKFIYYIVGLKTLLFFVNPLSILSVQWEK